MKPKTKQPTTFELAQLALQVRRDMPSQNGSFDAAVRTALDLWDSAAKAPDEPEGVKQQRKELIEGIFNLPPENWRKRIAEYMGNRDELMTMLHTQTLPRSKVEDALYDKNHRRATKTELLVSLPDLAKHFGVEFKDVCDVKYFGNLTNACRSLRVGVPAKLGLSEKDAADLTDNTPRSVQDDIPLIVCRWLYEIRQRQNSENKKRDYIVASGKKRVKPRSH